MKELYDDIVEKIIYHRVKYFLIENNTDTSLAYVIDEKLHERGYYGCVIKEKYSNENKEKRIKDNQGYVRGNITYPAKGLYPSNSDMGKAMEGITSYSFNYPNKFDDGIDSIVLFTMEFIDKDKNSFNEIGSFKR